MADRKYWQNWLSRVSTTHSKPESVLIWKRKGASADKLKWLRTKSRPPADVIVSLVHKLTSDKCLISSSWKAFQCVWLGFFFGSDLSIWLHLYIIKWLEGYFCRQFDCVFFGARMAIAIGTNDPAMWQRSYWHHMGRGPRGGRKLAVCGMVHVSAGLYHSFLVIACSLSPPHPSPFLPSARDNNLTCKFCQFCQMRYLQSLIRQVTSRWNTDRVHH